MLDKFFTNESPFGVYLKIWRFKNILPFYTFLSLQSNKSALKEDPLYFEIPMSVSLFLEIASIFAIFKEIGPLDIGLQYWPSCATLLAHQTDGEAIYIFMNQCLVLLHRQNNFAKGLILLYGQNVLSTEGSGIKFWLSGF